MINRGGLPMDADNATLTAHCETGVSILLNLYRQINERKLTGVYQVEDMIQGMINELEKIKEGE